MMKKIFLVLVLFWGSLGLFAQQPVDSIYVWVNIADDRILIDIPESYFSHRTVMPPLPSFVAVRKLSMVVPELQKKEVIIATLTTALSTSSRLNSRELRHTYLQEVVLYLYFNHNDSSTLPEQVKTNLQKWQAQPKEGIGREAELVWKWMEWKEFTD